MEEIYLEAEDFIDPFKDKIDHEDFQREYNFEEVNIDVEPVLYGPYGVYCPVTLVEKDWLVKGKFEFNTRMKGEAVLFCGEEEKERFIRNYKYYLEEFK